MTQYNTLNVKLSNSKLNNFKSSFNFLQPSNFPHKLLLTNLQVLKIRKAFTSGSSANIKLKKTQLFKMIQSGGFALYENTEPIIKGLESMPTFIDNELKHLLNNKNKISDTIL